jgi:superfamily II DNA or RNA helicase
MNNINSYINLNKNNTNFPSELTNILEELYNKNEENINKSLFDYQKYIYNYLVFTDARGILLYHSVGSGKTLTSISIAEEFRKMGKDLIILSSKSLQANYKKEIEKYNKLINNNISNLDIENIINQYKFVTSNSKNMISSLDDKLTNILDKYKDNKISLENKIIIIDEAHNLFNSIVNGSKIANEFYDLIMNTKKIKLLFLTGTPIINNPFEISVAFNMLYGKIYSNTMEISKKNKDYYTILPEYYNDFQKYFIDQSNNSIKNELKFQNRIFGLVSYYGDMYTEILDSIKNNIKTIKKKENYPDRLPIKIEIIEMSLIQNIEYSKARDIEKKENTRFGGIKGSSIVKEKNVISTSYRIKSRQLSNILIPDTIELTLYNFEKYSPKLVSIYNNIKNNHLNQINLVYSNFLESGLIPFTKILELNGYTNYLNNTNNNNLKYAVFSGQQTAEERENIIKLINSSENKTGDIISILLISKSGAEGLDLKNIRSVHIMEPYWNYSLIEQIIARAVRYKSHELLKLEDRNVQTYIYLSDYNKDYLKKEKLKLKENIKVQKNKNKETKIEYTTDINIFKNAIKNQELIQIFLKSIASTSIECKFFNKENKNYNCFDCINNNKQLYYPDIHKDMELSNNCIRSSKIIAKEIIINGDKYYYTNKENKLNVFKYDNNLNGYKLVYDNLIIDKIQKMI